MDGFIEHRQDVGMNTENPQFQALHSFLNGYREAGDLVRYQGKPDLLAAMLTESKDPDMLRGALTCLYHLARGGD